MKAKIIGGDKWTKKIAEIAKGADLELRIGVLENATNNGVPVVNYAIKNEFGADGIPARPYLRTTVKENSRKWATGFERLMKNQTSNPGAVDRAFRLLGEQAVGDIKQTIMSSVPPPNAPATIEQKGPGKPTLFDTGSLLKAHGYVVIKGKRR